MQIGKGKGASEAKLDAVKLHSIGGHLDASEAR